MTPKGKSTEEFVTISIRFPRPLYDWLNQMRKAENRSFNQQVLWIFAQYLYEKKAKAQKEGGNGTAG